LFASFLHARSAPCAVARIISSQGYGQELVRGEGDGGGGGWRPRKDQGGVCGMGAGRGMGDVGCGGENGPKVTRRRATLQDLVTYSPCQHGGHPQAQKRGSA